MSGILYEESPLVINPALARVIGLNEAIVLQQLHYWISKNTNIHNGKSWVYNTIQEWREQFSFWGTNTVRRTLESLQKDGIVITGNYNERKFDKTLWYSIDYEALDVIVKNRKSSCPKWANASAQNGQKELPKMGKPIPENTIDYTETTDNTPLTPQKEETHKNTKSAHKEKLELMVGASSLSNELKVSLLKWLDYKKYAYVEKGFEALLSVAEKNALEYGDTAVCSVISESMGNMYKGIIWDKLKNRRGQQFGEPPPRESQSDMVSRVVERLKNAKD